ncbi:unnamed protein product [Soboliphyme baturini]|uniref:OrfB_Zn_ribbon domain-containing protein n=1 Tax=Soboliphyme baturini TaxID=241478 RepID=A0A183JB52_9BILA|nr:unnamed protein product [Soboliphyme baturini]
MRFSIRIWSQVCGYFVNWLTAEGEGETWRTAFTCHDCGQTEENAFRLSGLGKFARAARSSGCPMAKRTSDRLQLAEFVLGEAVCDGGQASLSPLRAPSVDGRPAVIGGHRRSTGAAR